MTARVAHVCFVTNIFKKPRLIERSLSAFFFLHFFFFTSCWIFVWCIIWLPVNYLYIEWTICNTPLTQATFGIDEGDQALSTSQVCLCLCKLALFPVTIVGEYYILCYFVQILVNKRHVIVGYHLIVIVVYYIGSVSPGI